MIALDTHALVWWAAEPARLGAKARKLIEVHQKRGEPAIVSSISIWEIAMLTKSGRLQLSVDTTTWIERVEALPTLVFAPVDNRIARLSVELDGFPHPDPADRIVVATALNIGATLVTADARIHGYGAVKTVWN